MKRWLLCNDLQLGADKSEVVVLCTAQQLQSAAVSASVDATSSPLPVTQQIIKSLRVIIDDICASMSIPTPPSVRAYYTRALRHVRTVLSDATAKSFAYSIVMSKLDYCSSLLHGAPPSNR